MTRRRPKRWSSRPTAPHRDDNDPLDEIIAEEISADPAGGLTRGNRLMFGGGGGMGGFGGPANRAGSDSGLPFAGLPSEMVPLIEQLLKDEPDHPVPEVDFSQNTFDRRPATLRRLFAPAKWSVLGVLILIVLETVAGRLGPTLTSLAIDKGMGLDQLGQRTLHPSRNYLYGIVILYFVLIFVSIGVGYFRTYWAGKLNESVIYRLRVRVFSHFQRMSLDFFTDERAGVLMTRMTADIENLQLSLQEGIVQLLVQGLTLVVLTIQLVYFSRRLAEITLLIVVPTMLVITVWFQRASIRGYLIVRDRLSRRPLGSVREPGRDPPGLRPQPPAPEHRRSHQHRRRVLRSQRLHGQGGGPLRARQRGHRQHRHPARRAHRRPHGAAGQDAGRRAGRLHPGPGQLLRPNPADGPAVQHLPAGQRRAVQAARSPDRRALRHRGARRRGAATIEGRITLEGVSFGYDPANPVLHDVDLEIAPGETYSLVGATGAGKSTIAKLVTRFYDPTAGRVLIDGHDLRGVTIASLRQQVGVVPQEPFLFNGTLRDNIAFARPTATDEEVLEAARVVGLDDLIERLPEGMTRRCTSGARRCPPVSASCWPWPEPSWPGPGCWSSTRPPRAWTSSRSRWSSGPSTSSSRAAPPSSSPTGWPPPCGRTRSRSSATAWSLELGSHDELVALGGLYAEMYATWQRTCTRRLRSRARRPAG